MRFACQSACWRWDCTKSSRASNQFLDILLSSPRNRNLDFRLPLLACHTCRRYRPLPEQFASIPQLIPLPYLVHPTSHPPLGGPSTCALAYSIGTPPFPTTSPSILTPPNSPFRVVACRYNLPPSSNPTLSSSHAARMAVYCLSSSSSACRRELCRCSWAARWMVQWRRARRREKRRGRGVAGWCRW